MRNRAKCKLCKDVIESFIKSDYVECSCGHIGIAGGSEQFVSFSKNYEDFLRIDDHGNEIPVIYKENNDSEQDQQESHTALSLKEKVEMLKEMAKNIERLPVHAMNQPITHYDHCSLMLLLSSIFGDLISDN